MGVEKWSDINPTKWQSHRWGTSILPKICGQSRTWQFNHDDEYLIRCVHGFSMKYDLSKLNSLTGILEVAANHADFIKLARKLNAKTIQPKHTYYNYERRPFHLRDT